jgi:hypothetical protein
MPGRNACIRRSGPNRLVSITDLKTSMGTASTGACTVSPALLTQDVELARRRDRGLNRLRIGDVERHLVACIEVGEIGEVTRRRHDVVASGMQLGGEGVPESTRRARDQHASTSHCGHVTAS